MALYTSTQTTSNGIVVNAVLDTVTSTITYTATAPNGVIATTTQDTNPPGLRAISSQLIQGNVETGDDVFIRVLNSVYDNVKSQAATAAAAAEVTSEPPPQESQPIPVNPTVDPQQGAYYEPGSGPGTVITEPQPTDEFEGLDLAVATQANALQEPPVLSDQEVDQYLANVEVPSYDQAPDIDTTQDAAENAKFARQQSESNAPVNSSSPSAKGSARGLTGKIKNTRQQATAQDNGNYNLLKDWRVKLSLAPGANYLYKGVKVPGILAPLARTDGVVFPYTPTVTVNYTAGYDPTELIHSNYKVFQYRSSAVDSISITGDFTAQDTFEANYLLAVIHFFRSVTKMFYGQDSNPVNGVPPPLCYLTGYGAFNFDHHPLVISNFTCTFPNDVDYIRATTHDTMPAGSNTNEQNVPDNSETVQGARMAGANVQSGARPNSPEWSTARTFSGNTGSTVDPTYVPTKMSIQVTAYPIVSRNDISRRFSLRDYATGKLLRGSKSPTGGGIW